MSTHWSNKTTQELPNINDLVRLVRWSKTVCAGLKYHFTKAKPSITMYLLEHTHTHLSIQ